MLSILKSYIKTTPLIDVYTYTKSWVAHPISQYDEAEILNKWVSRLAPPRLFVEFGFGGWEFNCASLARKRWPGMLVDGDPYNARVAKVLFSPHVVARTAWLTLDNLDMIAAFVD